MPFAYIALPSPSDLSSTYDTLIAGGTGLLMAIPSLASASRGSIGKLRAWLQRNAKRQSPGQSLGQSPSPAPHACHTGQAMTRQVMSAYFEAMQGREALAAMREQKGKSIRPHEAPKAEPLPRPLETTRPKSITSGSASC